MKELSFEWDNNKNASNRKKHGVSFEEAVTVFYDENALLEFDEQHSVFEERFRILGFSSSGNLLLVVHCVKNSHIIRIISSRKARQQEIKGYMERYCYEK